uniref:Uncharacterized protein n=1 Tax=Cannabis sativa TaxID=3483 RepID=A0A803NKK6_CANSA
MIDICLAGGEVAPHISLDVIVTPGGPIEASLEDPEVILLEEGEINPFISKNGKQKEQASATSSSKRAMTSTTPSQGIFSLGIHSKADQFPCVPPIPLTHVHLNPKHTTLCVARHTVDVDEQAKGLAEAKVLKKNLIEQGYAVARESQGIVEVCADLEKAKVPEGGLGLLSPTIGGQACRSQKDADLSTAKLEIETLKHQLKSLEELHQGDL